MKDTKLSHNAILALSGQLSTFGQNHKNEFIPFYLIDFVIGLGLSILIQQYLLKLKDIKNSKEQLLTPIIHQISLIELVKYFGAFNISAK